MWMFRYLDSNQDTRLQSPLRCQLRHTGQNASSVSVGCRHHCWHKDTGHADPALSTGEHGAGGPALNLAEETAAPPDGDPQAAAVALANVLAHGLGVVGRLNVCGLMYGHAKYQVVARDAGRVEEPQEKPISAGSLLIN